MSRARLSIALGLVILGAAGACVDNSEEPVPGNGGRIAPSEGAEQAGSAGSGDSGAAGSGGGTRPPLGPNDVVVDTFNVALAGAFIPYEAQRRPALIDAIASLDSDIVCLQEVWEQADKEAIKSAAAAKLPSAVFFKHDLSTPIASPVDLEGNTPPPKTAPPCSKPALADALNKAVDCLRDKCSTDPGNEQAQTTSAGCAQEKCLLEAAALLESPESQQCYGCLAPLMPASTFAEIREECVHETNSGLAFEGQSGVMILSKHPLTNAEAYVMPGSWNRRVVLRATAELENGAKVDVYCNHTTPIFTGLIYPYTGSYGAGPDPNPWVNEQLLQAKLLTSYVAQKSGDGRAIILGDFNASHEVKIGNDVVIKGDGAGSLELLDGAFASGVASGYQPACTYCPENNNVEDNDPGAPEWLDHIFLKGIAASAVTWTERTFTEKVVPVKSPEGEDIKTELSDHYGLRSFVTITP